MFRVKLDYGWWWLIKVGLGLLIKPQVGNFLMFNETICFYCYFQETVAQASCFCFVSFIYQFQGIVNFIEWKMVPSVQLN